MKNHHIVDIISLKYNKNLYLSYLTQQDVDIL